MPDLPPICALLEASQNAASTARSRRCSKQQSNAIGLAAGSTLSKGKWERAATAGAAHDGGGGGGDDDTCSMDVSVSESSAEVGSSQSTIDGCARPRASRGVKAADEVNVCKLVRGGGGVCGLRGT
eukprot:6212962-Pleurochrysis_carterae.AAC.2